MKLTEKARDELREVENICAGKASNTLAKMIKRSVGIEKIDIDIIHPDYICQRFGCQNNGSIGILFRVNGPLPGHILLISTQASYRLILATVEKKKVPQELTPEDIDALKEIGNIIVGNYLAALSDYSNLNVLESVPHVVIDPNETITDHISEICESRPDQTLILYARLRIEKENQPEEMIHILHPESAKILINRIAKKETTQNKPSHESQTNKVQK